MSQAVEQIDLEPLAGYMKPRSIILDLFGDYLRYGGNRVKAGDLVTLLGVFGVEPATVRMTLSRLRREGWFTTEKVGRETVYRLTDLMLDVLEQGRARIFADYDRTWDRSWTVVVHAGGLERFTRDQIRKRLAWLGFGPLSASTWLAPWSREEDMVALRAELGDAEAVVMRSTTSSLAEDRALAERCWDLPTIDHAYTVFLTEHASLPATAPGLVGADALVARTSLIAGFRHFPFIDPWLPAELRPADWAGSAANRLFRSTHEALAEAANAFVGSVAHG